jgi:plastocyanin
MKVLPLLLALATLATLGTAMAGATHQVTVSNFQFTDSSTGQSVTQAAVGDVIHWTWISGTHSVTAGLNGATDAVTGQAFNSGVQTAGLTNGYSFTPTAPGVYVYYCMIHAQMRGQIVVTG